MSAGLEKLISQLDTSSDHAAARVISRICKIGSSAVPRLIECARDPSRPKIQKWSLEALGTLADRRGGTVLKAALRDERMTVKLHAVRGLARMKYRPAAREIAALLRDSSGGIRVNAIYALIALKAQGLDQALVRCLADPQWYVRQTASRACRELKIKGAAPALKRLIAREKRKAVLVEAQAALESLGL